MSALPWRLPNSTLKAPKTLCSTLTVSFVRPQNISLKRRRQRMSKKSYTLQVCVMWSRPGTNTKNAAGILYFPIDRYPITIQGGRFFTAFHSLLLHLFLTRTGNSMILCDRWINTYGEGPSPYVFPSPAYNFRFFDRSSVIARFGLKFNKSNNFLFSNQNFVFPEIP